MLQMELKIWHMKAEGGSKDKQYAEEKVRSLEACLQDYEIKLCYLAGVAGYLTG
jgi:hypothetical protein